MDRKDHAIRQLYRTDLPSFIRLAFRLVYPQARLLPHWSVDLLGLVLGRCAGGQTKRLILNLPPRYLKSFCASVALPAWVLARQPEMKIMCIAGSAGLAADQHQMTCQLMGHPRFRALFPHLRTWREQGQTVQLPHGGRRSAHVLSPGSGITGRGADLIILDDPLPAGYAEDDARRMEVNRWCDHHIYQRLDDKHQGTIIVVMQRLAHDDLTAHLLAQGGWEWLRLPAIATADEHPEPVGLPGHQPLRRPGEALHPAREDRDQLRQVMLRIGARAFMAQYQQQPYPPGKGVVRDGGARHIPVEPVCTQDEEGNTVAAGRGYLPIFLLPTPEERGLLTEVFQDSAAAAAAAVPWASP